MPKDDLGGDLLSSSGLVTSSEEYYPTVAINALMRALKDPAMSSHHPQVVRSLFYIFQALQLAAVPFLPRVSALSGLCIPLIHMKTPLETQQKEQGRLGAALRCSSAVVACHRLGSSGEPDASCGTLLPAVREELSPPWVLWRRSCQRCWGCSGPRTRRCRSS